MSQYQERNEEDRRITTGWVYGFLTRHPDLISEKTIVLEASRYLACSKENLLPFYQFISTVYSESEINPSLLFNLDETSINYTRRTVRKAICTRSHREGKYCIHPNRIISSTLVMCIPAEGKALDTTLIWPQKTVPVEFNLFPLQDIHIYCQSSAYQTRESFTKMMINYYLPEMIRRRTVLKKESTPIILFLDGHSSRLSIPVIRFAFQHNIKLIILPAHTSSITQPLDRCSNGVLKKVFSSLCLTHTNLSKTPRSTPKGEVEEVPSEKEYIPSETSDQSASDSDDVADQSPQEDETKSTETSHKTEIEYDASPVDDSDSDEEGAPPIPDKFLPQSALIYKPSASHERKLLAAILPRAIRKATDYDVMRAGWEKSGLYPFDQVHPIEWLPLGARVQEKKSSIPSISGKIITDPAVRLSIWRWALARKMKNESSTEESLSELKNEIAKLEADISEVTNPSTETEIVSQSEPETEKTKLLSEDDTQTLERAATVFQKRYAYQEALDDAIEASELQHNRDDQDDDDSQQYSPPRRMKSDLKMSEDEKRDTELEELKRFRRIRHYKRVADDMMTW